LQCTQTSQGVPYGSPFIQCRFLDLKSSKAIIDSSLGDGDKIRQLLWVELLNRSLVLIFPRIAQDPLLL
jgi:hypothetical protein